MEKEPSAVFTRPLDNPPLREPLDLEDITPCLLGHRGTTLGLNFIYTRLNRMIRKRDHDVIYVCGPLTRRSRHGSA